MSQNELRTKSEIEEALHLCKQSLGIDFANSEKSSFWRGQISALLWVLKREE